MYTAIWVATGFFLGSIPFSYLIGILFLRKDIRDFGDKAPGATNVARAGGRVLYVVSILLDAFKGTVPVLLAQILSGVTGLELILVAVAPVLGHAFTPFLKFQGGQGVATTFGVWLALTGWIGPLVLGACAGLMFLVQKNWAWSTMGGMIGLLVFLLAAHYPLQMAGTWAGHTLVLLYKRRQLFRSWPEMQPWFAKQEKKR